MALQISNSQPDPTFSRHFKQDGTLEWYDADNLFASVGIDATSTADEAAVASRDFSRSILEILESQLDSICDESDQDEEKGDDDGDEETGEEAECREAVSNPEPHKSLDEYYLPAGSFEGSLDKLTVFNHCPQSKADAHLDRGLLTLLYSPGNNHFIVHNRKCNKFTQGSKAEGFVSHAEN